MLSISPLNKNATLRFFVSYFLSVLLRTCIKVLLLKFTLFQTLSRHLPHPLKDRRMFCELQGVDQKQRILKSADAAPTIR